MDGDAEIALRCGGEDQAGVAVEDGLRKLSGNGRRRNGRLEGARRGKRQGGKAQNCRNPECIAQGGGRQEMRLGKHVQQSS